MPNHRMLRPQAEVLLAGGIRRYLVHEDKENVM